MRLAFCLFRYFPFSGLARDMLRIAERARARGHEITIFTANWQGDPADDFQTEVLKVSGFSNHGQAAQFHHKLKPRVQNGFDAVVGFNKIPDLDLYYAADACFAARARYQRHPLYRLTPRYLGFRRLEHAVFSRHSGTRILALSENAVSEFQEFYGTGDARFTLLPPTLQDRYRNSLSGIDIRTRIRAELEIRQDEQMILMVGSGFRTKGVDRAILAVAALPPTLRQTTRLVVAGNGKARPFESQSEASGVKSQVSFLGGRDDIPDLMAAADVLLHPARNENTGAVLLEAMAMGLPILTTGVCGYARYVTEADAGLVLDAPFDQGALNHTLDKMLSVDASAWRRNGPRYASQPLFFSMPDKAVDVIEDVAANPGRRGKARSSDVYLSDDLNMSNSEVTLDSVLNTPGELFRQAPGRRTLKVTRDGHGYFLKIHSGVGWREIVKNLLSLKLPVLGARNEWHALHLLRRLGINAPRPLGFGIRGSNPAHQESFVIMEEIKNSTSLETLCAQQGWSDDVRLKHALIAHLAGIARTLHLNGINHRDFYLCHFLVDEHITDKDREPHRRPSNVALIDLHRAQVRRRTPMRWIVKDLGGLYYSAMDAGLTRGDLCRFIRAYSGLPLRQSLDGPIDWNRVRHRACALYRAAS
jgi:UDP-glucose:(heptosyl)LPS alpha-1,3-glucosyltransferase